MESTVPPLRPLTASELIDETFQIYRRHFRLFISISAILMIPLGVIEVLQQVAIQRQDTTSGLLAVGLVSLVVSLLRLFVYLGILSAIIYAASEVRMGRTPGVSESYSNGMNQYASMLRVAILLVIALPLISITIIGIPVAIYLAVGWMLSMHVAVIEDEGAFASMSRSRELVKGHWWRVLGITFLVSTIVFIASLVFSIPGIIAGLPMIFSPDTQSISVGATMISTLFNTAGSIVTGPILYIAWLLLYYDLRARKEGLDLEIMAHQAESEARSAAFNP